MPSTNVVVYPVESMPAPLWDACGLKLIQLLLLTINNNQKSRNK